jgi:hypothetical protein
VGHRISAYALGNDVHWSLEEMREGIVATCRVRLWAVRAAVCTLGDPNAAAFGQVGGSDCGASSIGGVSKTTTSPTPPVVLRSQTWRRHPSRGRENV